MDTRKKAHGSFSSDAPFTWSIRISSYFQSLAAHTERGGLACFRQSKHTTGNMRALQKIDEPGIALPSAIKSRFINLKNMLANILRNVLGNNAGKVAINKSAQAGTGASTVAAIATDATQQECNGVFNAGLSITKRALNKFVCNRSVLPGARAFGEVPCFVKEEARHAALLDHDAVASGDDEVRQVWR